MNVNILVVEDEVVVLQNMCEFIQGIGEPFLLLGSARNGVEALEYFRKQPVHILLTDIRMPQMDGLKLIEEVHKTWPQTYTVILSGYNDFKYAQQAIKYGVKDYLLKPLNKIELVSTLVGIYEKTYESIDSYASLMINQEKWDVNLISIEDQLIERVEIGNVNGAIESVTSLLEAFKSKVGEDALKIVPFVTDTLIMLNKRISSFEGLEIPLESPLHEIKKAVKSTYSYSQIKDAVIEYAASCAKSVQEYRTWSSPDVLFRCQEILKSHYMQNISLREMAELVNVTPSYLSRLIKKELGKTYLDYVHGLRLEKAKDLLSNKVLKIMEVANKVGYVNAYYFTRMFKKKYGMTPEEYRNGLKNGL